MRLDKLLANYGIGTRKEVKSLIRKGFVKVNGMIIKKDDFKVDHEIDEIVFDDELIEYRPYVYIMLNKPAGYISATKDNLHPTVLELIEGYENYDLFPVGRLDLDTEGLLLITNDGDFSHKLLAPSRNHSKIYFANIAHADKIVTIRPIAFELSSSHSMTTPSLVGSCPHRQPHRHFITGDYSTHVGVKLRTTHSTLHNSQALNNSTDRHINANTPDKHRP